MHRDVFLEIFLTSADYGDSQNIICSLIVHKNSEKPMTKVALYYFNFTTHMSQNFLIERLVLYYAGRVALYS